MAAAKLLNLIAVSTLAILAASFGATPVTAVSVDTVHIGRSHAHAALAKKRRGNNSKRCKPRPTSTPGNNNNNSNNNNNNNGGSKPTEAPKPPATTAKPAPPATTSKSSDGSNNNTPPPPPGPDGHGKVGLGWAVNDDNALKHFKTGSVGAIMTWSPWMPAVAKSLGFRRCPMLWGPKQISQFQSLVKPGYADCVMGFNEPDQPSQSNLSPDYAAKLWKQYIEPLKNQGYQLISPACTNAPSGKTWMKEFLKACNGGCTIHGLAVHFYGTDPNAMISYLKDMHSTFGYPVWATEFACQNFSGGPQCNKDQVWHFMQTVKPFMDSQSWIPHYFAFGTLYDMGNVNPLNQLLGSNGYPNALGSYYVQ